MMPAPDLMAWASRARPGEAIIYHRGLLAADRESEWHGYEAMVAAQTARHLAWRLYEEGRVLLVQRRLPAPGAGCEYVAIRVAGRPRPGDA